ncbi:rhomboid family intramembrane serine protease [Arthrobacter cryoconiti]|uniref:Rhomboid family intramembrane serine protease n=1 Tax=Arthrobacter cryoconiti TaxID=748907 RepID=A0ABV8R1R5_9MICC|nr:rhomboid family intramembrane serine protease [Arthrobacter cryoconiti]MCC9069892.1 rhomboid family intramembrane serine protease [Arthrobacter cryoconiti]
MKTKKDFQLWPSKWGIVFPAIFKTWRHAPATWILLVLLWVPGLLTGTLRSGQHPGWRSATVLTSSSLPEHWWTIITAAFWERGLVGYLIGTALLLVVGIPAERRLGSLRFIIAGLTAQTAGMVLTIGIVHGGRSLLGSWSAQLLTHSFVGPSAFLFGAALAATTSLGVLWRRRLRLTLFALLILLALYSGSFPDLIRLAAATVGVFLGPLLFGRTPRISVPISSRREARVLIALIVAASAVGPVLAGLLPHAVGPLSVLRFLFTNIQVVDPQTLQTLCSDPTQVKDCAAAQLQLRAGAGGIFMSILPSVLLLVIADGLRRGRRFAWYAALIIQGGLGILAGSYIVTAFMPSGASMPSNEGLGAVEITAKYHPLGLILPLLLPVLLVILLLGTRRLFRVTAPPKTYLSLFGTLLTTAVVLSVIYVLAALGLASGFAPAPGLADLLADLPDRFLPLGYLLDLSPAFFPQSSATVILYEGIGITFWCIATVLMLRSFLRPAHDSQGTNALRARGILKATRGSSLSWMTQWSGNSYWFAESGNSFIAYRVLSGIALTLGPPVGPPTELLKTIDEFTRYTAENGWTPCFYSVPGEFRAATQDLGWGSVEVAQETILDLAGLSFTGKKFQDIRTALNKANKEGIHAQWISYPEAPLSIADQIHAISEEWVADKKMPEMGFTLGGLEEINDPEVRCLLAIDDQHTVHAIASWLPVYRDEIVVGWTLDFMRRRSSGFRASIEFLIASAALSCKEDGYEFLSLSGAPLARIEQTPTGSALHTPEPRRAGLDKLLEQLGAILEPVYGFKSLLTFKSKFQPRYEPLFMVYPDAAALPNIANAVGRAYLPKVSFQQSLNLAGRIIRHPAQRRRRV